MRAHAGSVALMATPPCVRQRVRDTNVLGWQPSSPTMFVQDLSVPLREDKNDD